MIPEPILEILEPFLTEMEGNKLTAYRDGAGVWTIGRGHTRGVVPGMVISEITSDSFLASDIANSYVGVIAHLGTGVLSNLTNHNVAALVSFTFNVGVAGFASSNLLKDINSEDFSQIEARLMAWDHMHVDGKLVESPGLRKRREAEFKLWSTPDDTTATDT